ncbi:hypothetical protein MPSEU_000837100 [Mayamaea pseudoterrestris]|nr:hypothetical protein MPSEU_000837100 [Mayamaea pseudoterrestris]
MNRKRARDTASPKPMSAPPPSSSRISAAMTQQEHHRAEQVLDPGSRNAALNELLIQSMSLDRSGSALASDVILKALAKVVLDDVNEGSENDLLDATNNDDDKPVLQASQVWIKAPTKRTEDLAKKFQSKLSNQGMISLHQKSSNSKDTMQTLQVILMIIRNYSYVSSNLRLLAYSTDVIDVLVGCLYENYDYNAGASTTTASTDDSSSSMAQSALQTLLHLAPTLDWTGQKLVTDRLFYAPNAESYPVPASDAETEFGQLANAASWGWMGLHLARRFDARDDVMTFDNSNNAGAGIGGGNANTTASAANSSMPMQDFVLALTGPRYLASTWSIFAGLTHIFTTIPAPPRQTILLGLDLLQEFVSQARIGLVGDVGVAESNSSVHNVPTLRAVLVHMPNAMLECLLECLYVPRYGPSSWDKQNIANRPNNNNNSKQPQGYEPTVDTELRDRALQVLVPLMELDSPRMAAKLGCRSNGQARLDLYNAIVPILTSTVPEASTHASHFLRELSKAPENRIGFEYVQERLVELASRNQRVAQLVWNHLERVSHVSPVLNVTPIFTLFDHAMQHNEDDIQQKPQARRDGSKRQKGVRFASQNTVHTLKRPLDDPAMDQTMHSGSAHRKQKRPRTGAANGVDDADESEDDDAVDQMILEDDAVDSPNDLVLSERELLRAKEKRREKREAGLDDDDEAAYESTKIDRTTSLAAEGVTFEPFNMDKEGSDGTGYFDGDTYVFRKRTEDEEPDAWLESLREENGRGAALYASAKDNDSESETEDGSVRMDDLDKNDLYATIIPLVSDTETIMQAIIRYGNLVKRKTGAKRQQQQAIGQQDPSMEAITLAQDSLNSLTQASSALMLQGQVDIYQMTRNQILAAIGGDDGDGNDDSQATLYQQDTNKVSSPKEVVQWEYQGSQDGQIHGPYSTSNMREWIQAGYFVGPSAVDVRYIAERERQSTAQEDLLNDLESDDDEDKKTTTETVRGEWIKSDQVDFSRFG